MKVALITGQDGFYLVTNFDVWIMGSYTYDLAGLSQSHHKMIKKCIKVF